MVQEYFSCLDKEDALRIFGKREKHFGLVLGFYKNGSLFERHEKQKLNPILIRKWIKQALNIIDMLFQQHVAHGDIRMENFLLDDADNLVICDFGLAYGLYLQKQWTLDKEIYNLGLMLYQLHMRAVGYLEKDAMDLYKKMMLPLEDRIRLPEIKNHQYLNVAL